MKMKFTRKYVVLSAAQSADNRVFAFFNLKKDAKEYAAKFPAYQHVKVYVTVEKKN